MRVLHLHPAIPLFDQAGPFLRSLIAAHHASPSFPILSTPKDASSFRRTDGEQKFVWHGEVKPGAAEGGGAKRPA